MKRDRLNEDITKAQIRDIIKSEIQTFLASKKFEQKVKEYSGDSFETFFKTMYNKRNFWRSEIKNG